MAVLHERQVWRRPKRRKGFQLADAEQARLRIALHALRLRLGGWPAVAVALGYTYKGVTGASYKQGKVSGSMALRIASVAGLAVEELLGGACPMCAGTGRQP